MSNFEIKANDLWTGISVVEHRVKDFGYSETPEDSKAAMSNVIGMFITWITATEEVRQNSIGNKGSFSKTVISVLPNLDDKTWKSYLDSPKGTLKERAESLWGIRIAFTHGNGDIDRIKNKTNKEYARNAANFLQGVVLDGNMLKLNSSISNHAIRTIFQSSKL